jgi:iron complex outermembrane receptor protein
MRLLIVALCFAGSSQADQQESSSAKTDSADDIGIRPGLVDPEPVEPQGDAPQNGESAEDESADGESDESQEDAFELPPLEEFAEQPFLVESPPAFEQEVTTVTRQPSTVGRSAAAVFVITNEMIRRSGVTSVPEALRLAPGLQVARIDANKWAISARGFNNRFANKLLVMIDGRIVYTQLFSGVYWEVQDLVLQDIERIEVIRGPGATVWGANAVNGVISIITKSAGDTQGALIASGGGDHDRSINVVRYGGTVGENFQYRIFGKHFERDKSFNPVGTHDDWRMGRWGFRADWNPTGCDCDTVTFQGQYFVGRFGNSLTNSIPVAPFTEFVIDDIDHSGGHLQTRWTHQIDKDSSTALQFYFDRTNRKDLQVDQLTDILDVDFQHRFLMGRRHAVTWGLRYRNVSDDTGSTNAFTFQVDPVQRTTDLISGWVQDEVSLLDDQIMFIAGSKFEHNDFTGFEMQPTGRLLWAPDERHAFWGAVSRAVRTPSRIEDDIRFRSFVSAPPPLFSVILGNRSIAAEDLMAYELGYRVQQTENFAWDIAAFHNDYEDLISFRQSGPLVGTDIPLSYDNIASAESYGVEVNAQWDIDQCWRLTGWYSFLQIQAHNTTNDALQEERSPHNQAFLMSSWDLPRGIECDVLARYVDVVPNVNAPNYIAMDVRLGWRPSQAWEFSVVGQNLLEEHHVEFAPTLVQTTPTEMSRSIYAHAIWRR